MRVSYGWRSSGSHGGRRAGSRTGPDVLGGPHPGLGGRTVVGAGQGREVAAWEWLAGMGWRCGALELVRGAGVAVQVAGCGWAAPEIEEQGVGCGESKEKGVYG